MSRPRGIFTVAEHQNASGTTSWRVTGTKLDNTRIRLNFTTEAQARAEKNALDREALNEGSPQKLLATTLSPQQLRMAELAFGKVKEDEFLAAVDYWVEREPVRLSKAPPVSDAVKAFTDWLDATKSLRELTKGNLRERVTALLKDYGGFKLTDMTAKLVRQLLGERKGISEVTRDNDKRALSRFFSWCIHPDREWLEFNPCTKIKIEKPEKGEPAILSVDECEQLLRAAEKLKKGRLVPFVTLCLFAGLRPNSEAKRLTWQQINLADKELRVEGTQTKTTGRSRVFDLAPTLRGQGKPHPGPDTIVRWLKAYEGKTLFPINWRRDFAAVKAVIGYGSHRRGLRAWPIDIMRHTAISHYIRLTGSYGQAAEQFGNSEAVIKKNYQGRVSSADTRKFYAILPTKRPGRRKDKKVIDFPTNQKVVREDSVKNTKANGLTSQAGSSG